MNRRTLVSLATATLLASAASAAERPVVSPPVRWQDTPETRLAVPAPRPPAGVSWSRPPEGASGHEHAALPERAHPPMATRRETRRFAAPDERHGIGRRPDRRRIERRFVVTHPMQDGRWVRYRDHAVPVDCDGAWEGEWEEEREALHPEDGTCDVYGPGIPPPPFPFYGPGWGVVTVTETVTTTPTVVYETVYEEAARAPRRHAKPKMRTKHRTPAPPRPGERG